MKYLLIFFSFILAGCGVDSMCENTVIGQWDSPNKALKLIQFDRDCGATTGNSIQFSILYAKEDLPDMGGNVFIAKGDMKGNIPARVGWINDTLLMIEYKQSMDVFKQEIKVKGVSLIYRIVE